MTHWAFFSPGVEPCRLHLKHQKILIKVTFVHCSMHLLFTAQCRKGLCSSSWFPIHYSLAGIQLDYETWIPGDVYKSWLNDASSLISKRHQVNTVCVCAIDYCFYWFRCLHDPLKLLFKMDLQKFDIVQSTNLNDLMNTPCSILLSEATYATMEEMHWSYFSWKFREWRQWRVQWAFRYISCKSNLTYYISLQIKCAY